MARIRSVFPGLLTDEAFMQLTLDRPLAVTLLIGLWMEADDSGTFEWKPLTLKARILPVAAVQLDELLDALAALNFIRRFEIEGRPFGVLRNFVKFQRTRTPIDVHPSTPETRAYAGFRDGVRPRAETGRPARQANLFEDDEPAAKTPRDVAPERAQPGLMQHDVALTPQREEEEEREEDNPPPPRAGAGAVARDRSGARPFAELTGAEIVPFPTSDPLEAEARALAAGLPLAADRDFSEIAALIAGGGAARGDVMAVIEEARAKREKCPKTWGRLASWAAARARERGAGAARSGTGPPAAADAPWRAHFEVVWAGFPRDRTASKPKAEAAFAQLSPDEQRDFAAVVGAVAAHIRGLKLTQPYDLARFTAERRFAGFAAGAAPATGPPKVRVLRDSPAGEAWERHLRATTGRGAAWSDGRWYFETEFPPAVVGVA